MSPSECRKGHILAALGKDKYGRCVACRHRAYQRYAASANSQASVALANAKYDRTPKGIMRDLRRKIAKKEARVTELEKELQYASS